MSIITGIIDVYDSFAIPVDNISHTSSTDKKIFIHLKGLAVDENIEHVFSISTPSVSQTKQFHGVIASTIHKNSGVAFIPLNGESLPAYRTHRELNEYDEGVLVTKQYEVKTSNIGAINFESDNGIRVLLRLPIKTPYKTVKDFYLEFNNQNERRIFHDELIAAICLGCRINYPISPNKPINPHEYSYIA